jgi:hypothetical protein
LKKTESELEVDPLVIAIRDNIAVNTIWPGSLEVAQCLNVSSEAGER